jgi:environmental stress-induced protein Ves
MIQHIPFSLFKAMPWKNGRGTTLEILKIGTHFRISQAKISEDGPFSHFPGMDRFITVLSGKGIILNGQTLLPLEGFLFSGDEDSRAELIEDAVEDFNVMVDRSWGQVRVEIKRIPSREPFILMATQRTFIYEIKKAPDLWVLEPSDSKSFFLDQDQILIIIYLTVI